LSLKKSHPSYQAKFQIHFELIKYHSIKKKDTPPKSRGIYSLQMGRGRGGGVNINYLKSELSSKLANFSAIYIMARTSFFLIRQ
jgi:hypothetical protein